MRIEQLQDIARRLSALVADPQPGYIGWCEALSRVGNDFVAGWTQGTGRLKSKDVVLVRHDHACGSDVTVCATFDRAKRRVVEILADNLDCVSEEFADGVIRHLLDENVFAAARCYADGTERPSADPERIEVTVMEVIE